MRVDFGLVVPRLKREEVGGDEASDRINFRARAVNECSVYGADSRVDVGLVVALRDVFAFEIRSDAAAQRIHAEDSGVCGAFCGRLGFDVDVHGAALCSDGKEVGEGVGAGDGTRDGGKVCLA